MPLRVLVSLICLTALPLFLVGWLLTTSIRNQEQQTRQRLGELLESELRSVADRTPQLLESQRQRLVTLFQQPSSAPPEILADLRRNDRMVQIGFWLDAKGRLLYPQFDRPLDGKSLEVTNRIEELIRNRPQRSPTSTDSSKTKVSQRPAIQSFWQTWYRDQGLQLVLWIELGKEGTVGLILNRSAWLSELLALLPDTDPNVGVNSKQVLVPTRTLLVDASGEVLYQWAPLADSTQTASAREPRWQQWAAVALPEPLSSWRLQREGTTPLVGGHSWNAPVVILLVGLGLLVFALGAYVTTEFRRQMRLAAQQVSFAGQVSHELRTPLTNIRLYAELAQRDLNALDLPIEATNKFEQRLVVIEQETQRLSRTCAGVLELVRPQPTSESTLIEVFSPDDAIGDVLAQFEPSFKRHSMVVNREFNAAQLVRCDRASLEMVVANLLSNVEKYAVQGGRVEISSQIDSNNLIVRIVDAGPGIPRRFRKKIFRPFFRVNWSIEAPSGTGIGLSIAQQSAQRAGGSLQLCPSSEGACFELRLPVEEMNP